MFARLGLGATVSPALVGNIGVNKMSQLPPTAMRALQQSLVRGGAGAGAGTAIRQTLDATTARMNAECETFIASRPDLVSAAESQGFTREQLTQMCSSSPSSFKAAAGEPVGKLSGPFYKNPYVIGGVVVAGIAAWLVLR